MPEPVASAPDPIAAVYRDRLRARQATHAGLNRRHAQLGYLRVAIAASAGVIVIAGGLAMLAWTLVPVAVFVGVAIVHGRLLNARDRAASAVAFYERGLARIEGRWIGHGRTGDGYRIPDHPFADDLDLFGRGSLFEMLATVRTHAGEEILARWLMTPAAGEEARARQAAVRELAGRLDLREAVAVLGDQVGVVVDAPVLRKWVAAPTRLPGPATRVALAALAAMTLVWVATWLHTGLFGGPTLAVLIAEGAAAWALRARVRAVIDGIEAPAHDLEVLADLLRILERERFDSPRLETLRRSLGETSDASHEIARLSRLVAWLASRRNVLIAVPAGLAMWATQWAFPIEAWRRRVGVRIPDWLTTVGEFEVLVAVGGYAAEHPEYVFPEITEGRPHLKAAALAHPTLGSGAVANDVDLADEAVRLVLVSGSNMSGKSTWLRAIGCSVVLGWLGAPARAHAYHCSPMAIGAAIRVQDSLTDGRSRFFAEITRLKQIVDLTRERPGVLFLLDEILSGTNSRDRRAGADALLRGLVSHGALGLVTTHDLALAAIVDGLPGQAVNAHFADTFVDDVLHFDYRLQPGVVDTSNAIALMRSIGLDV